MLFYRFTGMLKDTNDENEPVARHEKRAKAMSIRTKAERYSEALADGTFRFVGNISDREIIVGAIANGRLDAEKEALAFFAAIGIEVESCSAEEAECLAVINLLNNAQREGFVADDEQILRRYNIEALAESHFYPFSETMITETTDKAKLYSAAARELSVKTFSPELDRIFQSEKKSEFVGHPVHYLIESDDQGTAERMTDALLSALYMQGRIVSKRYVNLARHPHHMTDDLACSVYESCTGGTVVISLIDGFCEAGDELESFGEDVFDTVCCCAAEYGNKVLFVFHLPRECANIKKIIAEILGEFSFVELAEDNVSGVEAKAYIAELAKGGAVPADDLLFGQIDETKTYYGSELKKIYERWFGIKLKTDVFPGYASFAECKVKAAIEESKGSAYDELFSMIGLAEAKSVINKALNFYKLQRIYKDRGIDQARPAMHMVFTGNPGTAKTTVARLFARIMKENELLSRGHLVEVGRGDLVGRFVGWTAKTVEAKFREADGGVLFIDEAYSLVDDRDGSFGDEAINTIVQQMENRRGSMVVIFAGYPDKMEAFLDKNPGLRSRIAFHVPFSDYSAAELCDIAKHIGKTRGLKLSEGAIEKLEGVFEAARLSPDFGNGRYVRNLLEKTEMNMAGRLLSIEPDAMTAETLTMIMPEDIELPAAKPEKREKRIG
ncbi:MAG: AAA family ATPase, partial [Clostridia bacterium]|nr:AAA family ATPase [Clostridia bacterium]